MPRTLPEPKFPRSTEPDPLGGFLTGRDGWSRLDDDTWHHEGRDITIRVMPPGNSNRFQCSIKGSKPTVFGTRTGAECWIAAAGA